MKFLVTTVRELPAADRHVFIDLMLKAHHDRGDHRLALALKTLRHRNKVTIRSGSPDGKEWVETVYEFVGEGS